MCSELIFALKEVKQKPRRSMTQEFQEQNALLLDGRLLCRHFLWGRCIKVGSCRRRRRGLVSSETSRTLSACPAGVRRGTTASWSTFRAATTSSSSCASSTCRAAASKAKTAPTCTISFQSECVKQQAPPSVPECFPSSRSTVVSLQVLPQEGLLLPGSRLQVLPRAPDRRHLQAV